MTDPTARTSWDFDSLTALLALFAFDDTDMLWWRGEAPDAMTPPLYYCVNVNDVFAWGTSDVERIEPDDIPALAQAKADVAAVTGQRFGWEWATLWACRKRGQRMQGAAYKNLDERLHPLFDAVGPEREVNLINPKPHPSAMTPPAGGEA